MLKGSNIPPLHDHITRPGIAELYINNIYHWFGLPTKVISNRDP
jgi:hypothetical protein